MVVRIRAGLSRSSALSPEEAEALLQMAQRCRNLRLPGLGPIEIHPLDGTGLWRASLAVTREAPDPGMVALPLLADRMAEFWHLVPGSKIVLDDPTRMLSAESDRLAHDGRGHAPVDDLPMPWPPHNSMIAGPEPTPNSRPSTGRPGSTPHPDLVSRLEGLGAQLLQAVDQLERAQAQVRSSTTADEEIVLSERPDAIPADLLDQAIQGLYLDHEDPVLTTQSPGAEFTRLVLEQLQGRPQAATGAALVLARKVWAPRQIPGLVDQLNSMAHQESLPWPLRALSVKTIQCTDRPDGPALLRALAGSSTVQVARAAIRALGLTVAGETRALLRSSARIPALSAHAIAAMADTGDPVGCEIARDLAEDPRDEVRLSVAHHLPRLGGERSIPILERMQKDRTPAVALEATSSLASVCAISQLRDLLGSSNESQVVASLKGIARSDRVEVGALVLRASADPRTQVRESAIETLGELGLASATPALLARLDDPVADVVLAAIQALGQCGDRRSRRPLQSLAQTSGPIGVAAQHALDEGLRMDQPAPSSAVQVRGWRSSHFSDVERHRIQRILTSTDLEFSVHDWSFEATGDIQPRALEQLGAVAKALQQLDTSVHNLDWSVADGQGLLRRTPIGWVVSARRGSTVSTTTPAEAEGEGEASQPPALHSEVPDPGVLPAVPMGSENVHDKETEIRIVSPVEDDDAPTELLQGAPPIRTHATVPIAVGEALEEEEGSEEDAIQGIVLSVGTTTSVDNEVGGIIEVHSASDQADLDPGFADGDEPDLREGAAFIYIETPGQSEAPAFEIHRPSMDQVQAYAHQAPMDDDVDVFEAQAQEYRGQPREADPTGGPWAPLLVSETADEFLMELVWAGLDHQGRERLSLWLNSRNPVQIEAAARVIAAVGESADEGALRRALAHAEPRVRAAAAHALGTIGNPNIIDILSDAVEDPDPEVQSAAQKAIALIRTGENSNREG